jgi:hypothetical protein
MCCWLIFGDRFFMKFGRFIGQFGRILVFMNFPAAFTFKTSFGRFLPNFTKFCRILRKPTGPLASDLFASAEFLNLVRDTYARKNDYSLYPQTFITFDFLCQLCSFILLKKIKL